MKTRLYFIQSVIFLLFLNSCIKDENKLVYFIPGDQVYGWGTADYYGSKWEASAHWKYYQADSTIAIFMTTREFRGIDQDIAINEIPLKVGRFAIDGAFGIKGDGKIGSKLSLRNDDIYEISLERSITPFIQIVTLQHSNILDLGGNFKYI